MPLAKGVTEPLPRLSYMKPIEPHVSHSISTQPPWSSSKQRIQTNQIVYTDQWFWSPELNTKEERNMHALFRYFHSGKMFIGTTNGRIFLSILPLQNGGVANKRIVDDKYFLGSSNWAALNIRSCSSISAFKSDGGVSMVQGASRGIGLEFVRQLLGNYSEGHVIATCRNPDAATGLLDLKKKHTDRLSLVRLDVTNESTIDMAAKTIANTHGRLDLLINTSGILCIPTVLQPETTLSKVEKSSLLLSFEVNAVGPVLVIKHMRPLLKLGGGQGTRRSIAIVANLSARVGSIGDNKLGGWHSYRASKTALNQLTKNISLEFAWRREPIICILLHPGTVDTDLSKPFQRNVLPGKLFTKEFSVEKLLGIIDGASKGDNGKFLAWDGQEIPW